MLPPFSWFAFFSSRAKEYNKKHFNISIIKVCSLDSADWNSATTICSCPLGHAPFSSTGMDQFYAVLSPPGSFSRLPHSSLQHVSIRSIPSHHTDHHAQNTGPSNDLPCREVSRGLGDFEYKADGPEAQGIGTAAGAALWWQSSQQSIHWGWRSVTQTYPNR